MDEPAIKLEFEVVTGRNIDVMVFEDIPFKNWKAGVRANALYYPGRIAADATTVYLPVPGTYHVVISNQYSIVTSKEVKVTARFTARIDI